MSAASAWRRSIARIAAQHGCSIEPTRSGHFRVRHANGQFTTVSGTPSDDRALLNARARIRKLGRGAA